VQPRLNGDSYRGGSAPSDSMGLVTQW